MRTGELSKILGRDNQTILNWMNQPELEPFLSPGALGRAGNAHRIYTESDVLVLNTVRSIVDQEKGAKINWEQIAQILEGGTRVQEFPQNAISRDDRLIPMPQAQQAAELMAALQQRDAALAQAEQMRKDLESEREARRLDAEKYLSDIRRLEREAGMWQARYEMLKEQTDKDENK